MPDRRIEEMATQNEQLSNLWAKFISDGVGSTTTNYIESARGALLRDVEGREFIDFAGGIGVMNIGHCHPKVVAAALQHIFEIGAQIEVHVGHGREQRLFDERADGLVAFAESPGMVGVSRHSLQTV